MISNEQLMERFQRNDEAAYVELVNRLKKPLLNFIFSIVGNREDSEDILQDVFLKLYTKKEMYKPIATVSTWLYTIAKNQCFTHLRWKKIRVHIPLVNKNEDGEKTFDIPDESEKHAGKLVERWQNILLKLQLIPIDFRTVLILRDFQELSYEEISLILNTPIGTIRSRLNRGRIRLAQMMEET